MHASTDVAFACDPSPPFANSLPNTETLQEAARRRLERAPYSELRRIACDFQEGAFTLRGRVSSYFLKQVAQTIIAAEECAHEIRNHLEVADY